MKVAVTGSLKAGENAPIIYRGDFKSIFPMMREDGFGAVELHLRDSREIDRKKLDNELEKKQSYAYIYWYRGSIWHLAFKYCRS